jgi:hypothetical protein
VFAAVYLLVQVALLATSASRPDTVFSFQMFNESSTLSIALSRRVRQSDGSVITVPTGGRWQARDAAGVGHAFAWNDRVRDPMVGTLGRTVHAAYGADAQLFHLQKALDDVMTHLSGDAETTALVADVEVRRNGKTPYRTRLESAK